MKFELTDPVPSFRDYVYSVVDISGLSRKYTPTIMNDQGVLHVFFYCVDGTILSFSHKSGESYFEGRADVIPGHDKEIQEDVQKILDSGFAEEISAERRTETVLEIESFKITPRIKRAS